MEPKHQEQQDNLVALQPRKQLQVVAGALQPLGDALRALKLKQTGVLLFADSDEVLDRPQARLNVGVNGENVKRAWATLVALRLEDLEPDEEDEEDEEVDPKEVRAALAADFKDFKTWCRDPNFLRAINLDPHIAVCWFVDVMLAANGDLSTED